jgi:transcriptional regulator with XRE-family HTH domain
MTRERAPPSAGGFPVDRTQREEGLVYAVMDGEKIRAMPQERDLSRQELAQEAGIAVETVARVERGDRVQARTGWRVARVFGVHPKEIGTPDPRHKWVRQLLGLEERNGG